MLPEHACLDESLQLESFIPGAGFSESECQLASDEVPDEVIKIDRAVSDGFNLAATQLGQDEHVADVHAELIAATAAAGMRCETGAKAPGPASLLCSLHCGTSCTPTLATHADVDELWPSPHRVDTCCNTGNL